MVKLKPMIGPIVKGVPTLVDGYVPFEADKKNEYQGWEFAPPGTWMFDTRALMDIVLSVLESPADQVLFPIST